MLHGSHQEATQLTVTQPRSQASGQSRREAAATERGSGERSQGKDDTGASTELGGEDHSSPVQDEVILAIPAVLSPESGAMTRVFEVSSPQTRRNLTADFGEATSSEVPDTLTAHKSIQSATTSKDAILEDTCNDKGLLNISSMCTETVSGLDTYVTLESEGEDDVGSGWDSEDLTGEGEPYFGVDEDGPPKPELLFEDELIKAVGGVGTISSGTVPTGPLRDMGKTGWAPLTKQTSYEYLQQPYEPRPPQSMMTYYPSLYSGEYGPTAGALEAAVTPSGAFFYFIQPTLLQDIAGASNDYFKEKLNERVEGVYKKQVEREKKHPGFKRKNRDKIREELHKTQDINGRELCIFISLLVARTISPNKEKLENHWKTTDEGAIIWGDMEIHVC
ncbi:hypothetical protein PC116_g26021 [Phytophthora cactorum]|nr:hypothetical protein PC116_g26021 [Phytophthora cactorum]